MPSGSSCRATRNLRCGHAFPPVVTVSRQTLAIPKLQRIVVDTDTHELFVKLEINVAARRVKVQTVKFALGVGSNVDGCVSVSLVGGNQRLQRVLVGSITVGKRKILLDQRTSIEVHVPFIVNLENILTNAERRGLNVAVPVLVGRAHVQIQSLFHCERMNWSKTQGHIRHERYHDFVPNVGSGGLHLRHQGHSDQL